MNCLNSNVQFKRLHNIVCCEGRYRLSVIDIFPFSAASPIADGLQTSTMDIADLINWQAHKEMASHGFWSSYKQPTLVGGTHSLYENRIAWIIRSNHLWWWVIRGGTATVRC